MSLRKHPDFGPVSERTFPESAIDDEFRSHLNAFKERKVLCDFRFEDSTFTLWRPWIDGQTQEEYFRGLSPIERVSFSHALFRFLYRKLREMNFGHGALHPGNMILAQRDGTHLVDAVFNSVRLCSDEALDYTVWLWAPCLPENWSLEDWDRVSLLRTAALLAQEPKVWEKQLTREEVVDLCRTWAEGYLKELSGNPFAGSVKETMELLPRMLEAFPLEGELELLAARQGDDHMLREKDEEALLKRAAAAGVESRKLAVDLQAWLLDKDFRREQEVGKLAEEFLMSGLYGKSKRLVTARACMAAERSFTYFGVPPEEAAARVEQLLARGGWIDERRAAVACRQFVAERLSDLDPSTEQTEKLVAGLAGAMLGYPEEVARRLVSLEIERRHLGLVGS
jgi:hypothetical protein